MSRLALVRPPGLSYPTCLVQAEERPDIDLERARAQHSAYARALGEIGFEVRALGPLDDLADSCFVEDVALLLSEVTVLLRPGAHVRRPEADAIEPDLARRWPVVRLVAPARIDGGDVLRMGRRLVVGLSSRTDGAGAEALSAAVAPFGYEVVTTEVRRGLHLKSAVCDAGPDLVVAEPDAVDPGLLAPARVVTVPPGAANVAWHGGTVLVASGSGAEAVLGREGMRVVALDLSEFAKGDGGPTCLSLREG